MPRPRIDSDDHTFWIGMALGLLVGLAFWMAVFYVYGA